MLNVLAGIVSHLQLRENEWTAEAVGGYAALFTYLLIVNMHSLTHLLEFFYSPQNLLEYFWGAAERFASEARHLTSCGASAYPMMKSVICFRSGQGTKVGIHCA